MVAERGRHAWGWDSLRKNGEKAEEAGRNFGTMWKCYSQWAAIQLSIFLHDLPLHQSGSQFIQALVRIRKNSFFPQVKDGTLLYVIWSGQPYRQAWLLCLELLSRAQPRSLFRLPIPPYCPTWSPAHKKWEHGTHWLPPALTHYDSLGSVHNLHKRTWKPSLE